MAMVICNGGKVRLMAALIATLNTYVLRLYKNNHTPVDTDTVADYTEANFTGYSSIPLNAWGTAFLNGSNKGQTEMSTQFFTQTGTGTTCDVYGYYVTDGSGNLIWAELNPDGVFHMVNTGSVYEVTPKLTDDTMP